LARNSGLLHCIDFQIHSIMELISRIKGIT
jgi:hypothetical protein